MNSEHNISLASSQKQLKGITSHDNMSDVNWEAYNAFRCDLAKVHKTFACCTQTDFTKEVETLTDTSLGCKFLGTKPIKLRSQSLPPSGKLK